MTINRRKWLAVVAGSLVAPWIFTASAASFPTEPIELVVPRGPGGGSDIIARLLAPGLQKRLGVSVVVKNMPDITAVRGAVAVAHAKPDGYTLYLSDNSFYQNPAILPKLPYDTIKDFSAVTMMATGPVILIVNPSLPVKNLKELIALARKEPGKLSFSSGGIGSSTHLAGVMLGLKTGITILHVPYKGSGAALNALIGGQVSMQFGGISSAKPMIEAGKARAIAVSGDHRDPSMPNVPTLQESGVKGADVMSEWGIHAPAGTPLKIREKLQKAIAATLHDPKLTLRLNQLGYTVLANTPQECQKQTDDLVKRWIDLSKKVDLHR